MHVSDLMVDKKKGGEWKRVGKYSCACGELSFPLLSVAGEKSLTVLKNSIGGIDGSIMVSRFQLAWPNFLVPPIFHRQPPFTQKTCSTRAINVGNKLQLCLFAKCLIFQSNASQYPKTLNQKPQGQQKRKPLPWALFI